MATQVDAEGWTAAIPQIREHYDRFGDKLPAQLQMAVDSLEAKLGFFTPKDFSVDAFLSGVLRDDPNPRNRANCFFAMGSRASVATAERCFLTAAADLRAFGPHRGMILSGLSNFSSRVPDATIRRVRDALLLDKGWSDAQRQKLQKIRGK